ncbi:MAG: hypothetical protein Q4D80_04805 [Pseudomonadota bacterium]|nr:hypothetical protein [Pseudomonadota bacterium]
MKKFIFCLVIITGMLTLNSCSCFEVIDYPYYGYYTNYGYGYSYGYTGGCYTVCYPTPLPPPPPCHYRHRR